MELLLARLSNVIDDFYDGIQNENAATCPECGCAVDRCNCNNIDR